MPVWNDKGMEYQTASGHLSEKSAFTWILPLSNAYQLCSWNVWVLHHHYVNALDMNTIIVFCVLGLQYKWNQLNSNNHTGCIHKGLHAGNWPDLITSKPDALSTPGYHWNHAGWCYRPVVFQWQSSVHWDATGTTLTDASTQWYPSGNPVYTGMPLDPHWLMLAPSGIPVTWNHTGCC